MTEHQYDIVFSGSGLAGLISSLCFARLDYKIAIIEKDSIASIEKNNSRTIALSVKNIQFLESLGISFDDIDMGTIQDIRITCEHSPTYIHFNLKNREESNADDNSNFGYIIYQSDLKRIVMQELGNRVTYHENTYPSNIENTPHHVLVTLANESVLKAKLFIISEGKYSQTRRNLNFKMIYMNYEQTATVFVTKHKQKHYNTAQEIFLPTGPLATLPLKNPNESAIVWTIDNELLPIITEKKSIISPDESKDFQNQFNNYIDGCLGQHEIISTICNYPLELSCAKNFFMNRVLLIGDTAHSVHPVSGQGFNVTLRGIELIYKMSSNWHSKDIGQFMFLNKYSKIHFRQNVLPIMISTDFFVRGFSKKSVIPSSLLKVGFGIVEKSKTLKKIALKYMI